MKRKTRLALVVCVCVFLAFFFFAPVVGMDIIPCQHYGYGYSPLSYYLFNVGETLLNGHFYWMTQLCQLHLTVIALNATRSGSSYDATAPTPASPAPPAAPAPPTPSAARS